MTEIVYFARCPEHGLHGCRTRCFECGEEVEQVPMVALADYEVLRNAAMWVVDNWDLESTQHGSMPGLREALGLPRERPTREEALARIVARATPA